MNQTQLGWVMVVLSAVMLLAMLIQLVRKWSWFFAAFAVAFIGFEIRGLEHVTPLSHGLHTVAEVLTWAGLTAAILTTRRLGKIELIKRQSDVKNT